MSEGSFGLCTKSSQGAQRGEDGDVAGGVAQSKRDGQSGIQRTPLQAAVSGKKQEIVEYLLGKCPDLLSEKYEGKNILHLAVFSKNIDTLQFLLDKYNGDIKEMINEMYSDQTPLDIAYQLLKNPDIKNEESKTKTINIINLLIKHGATANIYDENGNLKGKGYLYDNIKIKF